MNTTTDKAFDATKLDLRELADLIAKRRFSRVKRQHAIWVFQEVGSII